MAVYRQIHIEFWQSKFVMKLTPEEKYFYLYLLTNSKTKQCGIYDLPKRLICFDTGYNMETVDKLLSRFIEYGKILYDEDTEEIMLLNWLDHNRNTSPKVVACIKKELSSVRTKQFLNKFNTLSIQYGYSMDTQTQKEKEKEKEKKEEQEKMTDINLFKTFESNFGRTLAPLEIDLVKDWGNRYTTDIVQEALKIAIVNGKYNFKYIDSILLNWEKQNLKTLREIQEHEKAYTEKKLKLVQPEPTPEEKENKELQRNIEMATRAISTWLGYLEENPREEEILETINRPTFNYPREIKEAALINLGLERFIEKAVYKCIG